MEHEELFPLLCRVADGDRAAFSELYDKTSRHLYAVSLKMLKDSGLAEEATQDAYVKIWHNASSYQRSKGTVLTWMISIIRYRTLDIIRYHNIRNEVGLDDELSGAQETTKDGKVERQLEKCLGELNEGQRQAIHLAYFKGLSHQEIENHLSASLGTIKSWVRRGLQSLQRCLSV